MSTTTHASNSTSTTATAAVAPFDAFKGLSVFVTGHTGFKGAWLCEWLLMLGAKVTGFALEPPTTPALFDQLGLAGRIHADLRGDVRDASALASALAAARPQAVFHLAAQPLVRLSYEIPVETFATNVLGTANLLDAVRQSGHRCAIVAVTTDKCYENREWVHSYRETDPMGGYDPYSASKGCAELVAASWRRSFFGPAAPAALATARAGNVLGGGDWAADRIVPDAVRSLARGLPVGVRNPRATRPWQHVLEPLSGYLLLALRLLENLSASDAPACRARPERAVFEDAFNFGPPPESNRDVETLVRELLRHWPGELQIHPQTHAPHEAGLLNLAIDKARHTLRWQPTWDFRQTLEKTVAWYRQCQPDAGDGNGGGGGAAAADTAADAAGKFASTAAAENADNAGVSKECASAAANGIPAFTRRQIAEFMSAFRLVN